MLISLVDDLIDANGLERLWISLKYWPQQVLNCKTPIDFQFNAFLIPTLNSKEMNLLKLLDTMCSDQKLRKRKDTFFSRRDAFRSVWRLWVKKVAMACCSTWNFDGFVPTVAKAGHTASCIGCYWDFALTLEHLEYSCILPRTGLDYMWLLQPDQGDDFSKNQRPWVSSTWTVYARKLFQMYWIGTTPFPEPDFWYLQQKEYFFSIHRLPYILSTYLPSIWGLQAARKSLQGSGQLM